MFYQGRLFVFLGGSGVGKDTVMRAIQQVLPNTKLARRVITRSSHLGGEDFDSVTINEFMCLRQAGEFLCSWQAHELYYAVRRDVLDDLAAGRMVLLNGSRLAYPQMQAKLPDFKTVVLKIDPARQAQRLAARQRETDAQINVRLRRDAQIADSFADPADCFIVHNNGALQQTVEAVMTFMQRLEETD